MLKVKLFVRGKKHQRTYRIVVAESKSKRDGKYVDDLGFWNPQINEVRIDQKKLEKWQKNGAQLTEGVRSLIDPEFKKKREEKRKAKKAAKAKKGKAEAAEKPKTEEKVSKDQIEDKKE